MKNKFYTFLLTILGASVLSTNLSGCSMDMSSLGLGGEETAAQNIAANTPANAAQAQLQRNITTENVAETAAINPSIVYNFQDVQMLFGSQVIFGGFVSDEAITEVSCMMLDSIKPPSEERRPATTYNSVIRNAFIDNLTKLGAYSEEAPRIIRVQINDVDVDTTSGTWDFDLTFESSNGVSTRFERSYAFASGIDLTVCSSAAQSFRPALEQYVFDVVTSQDFAILAK